MPRKSLPASVTTPKARPSLARSQSTLKRRKLSHHPGSDLHPLGSTGRPTRRAAARSSLSVDPFKPEVVADAEDEAEKELEAWQDFAAEHYEMIEQLPLELHRNFRLLRELDDGCQGQQAKLESLVRQYITARLQLTSARQSEAQEQSPADDVAGVVEPTVPVDEEGAEHPEAEEEDEPVEQLEVDEGDPPNNGQTEPSSTDHVPAVYENEHTLAAEAEGVPIPDGRGGLVLPPAEPNGESALEGEHHVPIPFPSVPTSADPTPAPAEKDDNSANHMSQPPPSASPVSKRSLAHAPATGPHTILPDIARLAREILRTGEEKVAVALGAYNAIDRHIRALDSALEAHESAIILGMRPDTRPSTAIGALQAFQEVILEPDEGAIGLEGGPRRSKKKKGRKGQQLEEGEQTAGVPPLPEGLEVDPNEPRYCYCSQVSYGEMIACENEECPLEWFHLACAGFSAPPAGRWWCNVCRPKIGLGKGGGAGIQPKAANLKKSRKSR